MGQSFAAQPDQLQKYQLEWVPRSPDVNGGGAQGGRLVIRPYGTDVLLNALAIRDTSQHDGYPAIDNGNPEGPYDQVYATYKTLFIINEMDQPVSIQPVWSLDRTTWYSLGSATVVPAGNVDVATAIISVSTPSQYIPYVAIQATASTAPTVGSVTVTLARLG